jgi:hypothetical protein
VTDAGARPVAGAPGGTGAGSGAGTGAGAGPDGRTFAVPGASASAPRPS